MLMKPERIFSAILLLVALFLLYLAFGYDAPIAYDPLGPKPYPILILSLLALCSLYLAIRPHVANIDLGYTPPLLKNLGLCIIFMMIYATFFEWFGFPLATTCMAFGVGKLFGGRTLSCLITGIGLGVGLYVLFDRLLDVPLPLFGLM